MASPDRRLSVERLAVARLAIQHMQARRSARFGRWDQAFRQLDPKDKATLGPGKAPRVNFCRLTECVETKRKECDSKKWTLFKRNDGTEVKIHDVLGQIAAWVKRFEHIGDVVASFDPIHAALPWAGVKFLVEIATSDFETYAKMADGLEIVSRVIVQVAEVEKAIPRYTVAALGSELSRAIVGVYVKVLTFLATAQRFFEKSAGVRWMKGIFQNLQKAVKELVDGISTMIGDVYRLSNQMRWDESAVKSAERHQETMSQLNELLEHLTKPKEVLQKQRAQIRGWLAPIVTEDSQRESLALRHGTTCDWFLAHDKFKNWSQHHSTRSNILWIHAPAGFGKSVLCARLIDHMHGRSDEFGRVLYFYCSGEDDDRRHPFAILTSWIWQLVAKVDDAVGTVMEEEKIQQGINEGARTSVADQEYLWTLLKKLLTPNSRWTLVIDGYDECLDLPIRISKYNTKPCRGQFLQGLADAIRGAGTRVLLVSRNQPDIEAALRASGIKDPSTLELVDYRITKEDTRKDLSSYSQTIIKNKLGTGEELSAMADGAVYKSEGMFLWVALLDKNVQEGATLQIVEDLIKETPSEIQGAYQAELDRILDPKGKTTDRAVAILKWILYATRPLTVREMIEALAVTFNKSPTVYPRKSLPSGFAEAATDEKYVQNYIRMPCGSLIELRKAGEDTPMGAQTIHFVHFSVKEFLQGSQFRVLSSDRKLCFGAENLEHDWIASLCLQYMCYNEFDRTARDDIASVASFNRIYPFYSYTATNWSDHYSHGGGSGTRSATMGIVWRLFSTPCWRIWAGLFERHSRETSRDATGMLRRLGSSKRADTSFVTMDTETSSASKPSTADSEDEPTSSEDESISSEDESINSEDEWADKSRDFAKRGTAISPTPVYYAAILGLSNIIDRLAAAKPSDCTLDGGDLGSPLQAAVVSAHAAVIGVLLKHGADPSQRGGKYGTPLIAAVFLGSMDIFGQLVAACKDPNATDSEGKTALYHACALGALDMVTALVDAGADVAIKSKSGRSPLLRAVASNQVPVTVFLLQRGANADERDRHGETPLLLSTIGGHADMVAALLAKGADATLTDRWGRTALHLACYSNSAPLVRALLDCSTVAIDAADVNGRTPLDYAAQENAREAAAMLLARGASPLCKTSDAGITPYGWALLYRSHRVLELFDSQDTTSGADATVLVKLLAAALAAGMPTVIDSLFRSVTRSALSVDSVCDILGLALKGNSKAIFDGLAGYIRGLSSSDTTEPQQLGLWSDQEKHLIESISWGTNTQKAMVLDPVWQLYPAATQTVPDAMLPIAVANRSIDLVSLLLQRDADVYRQIAFTGYSIRYMYTFSPSTSPLEIAVNQDSRELVALMLEKGRRSGSKERGMALLTTLERTGYAGGMERVELARMLISHGALDADVEGAGTGPASGTKAATHNDEIRDLACWEAALIGEWEGYYTDPRGHPSDYTEPTFFLVDSTTRKSLSRLRRDVTLFDGGGEDQIGKFTIHGQVQSGTTVRYIKLYARHGWMYEGNVDETDSGWCIKGQWGSSFGNPCGCFAINKKT